MNMNTKKLADLTVKKSADYYNKVVKALEDTSHNSNAYPGTNRHEMVS